MKVKPKAYGDGYDINVREREERDDFRVRSLSIGKKRGRLKETPAWGCGDQEFGCAYVELEMFIYLLCFNSCVRLYFIRKP